MTKFLLTTAFSGLVVFSVCAANAMDVSDGNRPNPAVEQIGENHRFDEPHRMHEPNKPEKMDIFLNLTDEQKAKAKEIREQSRKDIEPLMKEMETIREKMDKVREADMKKFEDLLTPEQKAKLDELKKHREDMHENGDRPGFRPHKFEDFPKPGMIKD